MYSVTKEIYFCYGHRLLQHAGKCRHIHGHSVRAAITVATSQLDEHGMVCDFHDLARVAKDYVDGLLDHTLLLYHSDPLAPLLAAANERFLAMDQHPTAEAIAELIFKHMAEQGFAVRSVTLWETESAYATVQAPPHGPGRQP